ncbi:glycosyltransferase [Mycolicibacterium sp. GCM10028919]|uniref:glycosyltransferase n=1 Tax=Mycolicibacterium sp. GCM10028919 TaxID=3273401 RepID=UPI003615F15D
MPTLIVNPLKRTLAHYEKELMEILVECGSETVGYVDCVPGDGVAGPADRMSIALRTVTERIKLSHNVSEQTIIVIWPLFGYLEPLTLLGLARRNEVFIVVHDPLPLRRSYGQSRFARELFKLALHHPRLHVLYHTTLAQQVGVRVNGVAGAVVPHPIRLRQTAAGRPVRTRAARPVVRVLGQYKETRSMTALAGLGAHASTFCDLEIHGMGWPGVPGWTVSDRFVPEHDFARLVEKSDCIVIPYDSFYQSGVAVRCLESGVPLIAPRHEHIEQLYGVDWAGIVEDASDWHDALTRALAVDQVTLQRRYSSVAGRTVRAWEALLLGFSGVDH